MSKNKHHEVKSLWLNKKQVCIRLGHISYTTLDYLISDNGFPHGFNANVVKFHKWFIPEIEKWEEMNCNQNKIRDCNANNSNKYYIEV